MEILTDPGKYRIAQVGDLSSGTMTGPPHGSFGSLSRPMSFLSLRRPWISEYTHGPMATEHIAAMIIIPIAGERWDDLIACRAGKHSMIETPKSTNGNSSSLSAKPRGIVHLLATAIG